MKTTDLSHGMRVRLTDFGPTDISYRQRLLSLGLTCGVEIHVVRKAPLGCPIQLDIRGTAIAIRKEEAQYLEWEPV